MVASYVQPVQPIQTLLPPPNPQNPLQRMLAQYAAALKQRAMSRQEDEEEPTRIDNTIGSMFTGLPSRETGTPMREAALGPISTTPDTGDKATSPLPGKSSESPVGAPDDLAAAARNLSSKAETSKTGKAALFNISEDTNHSKSYGHFGLNNKSGSLRQFVNDNPDLGLPDPKDPGFDNAWRKAADVDSDKMEEAHNKWHSKYIMGGLSSQLTDAGVPAEIANDPRVQLYMSDRKVQMNNVGLNAALTHAKNATTPEQFIRTVDAVDKSRLGSNFKSYLADHPNHAQGLMNRHDLRMNTALSAADPTLTRSIVDFYRGGPGTGASPTKVAAADSDSSGSGPTTLAADVPRGTATGPVAGAVGRATPDGLPHGELEAQYAQYYNRALNAGYNHTEAAEIANNWVKSKIGTKGLEQGLMPQYAIPGDYGIGLYSEPGKAPSPYMMPGAVGKIEKWGDTDLYIRTRVLPDGRVTQEVISPTATKPPMGPAPGAIGTSPPTIPPVPSKGTTTTSVPPPVPPSPPPVATPGGAPGGMLSTTAPGTVPVAKSGSPPADMKTRVAGLGDFVLGMATGAPSSGAGKTSEDEFGTEGFNTKDPLESKALDYMNHAYAEERGRDPLTIGKLGAPNVLGLAEKGDLPGILQHKKNEEAYGRGLSEILVDTSKKYADYETSFRDAAKQSGNLASGLNEALEVISSPEFQSGPANEVVSLGRGLREELGNIMSDLERDAISRKEDPGIYKSIREWALDPSNRTATANQVFSKILAGTTLQSLRGMLGPNSGQFRQYEMQLMREALGNPNMTPEAIATVLTMAKKMNDRSILLGKMAAQYASVRGGLDRSFEKYADLFEKNYPPYTHADLEEARKKIMERKGSVASPTPAPAPSAPATPKPGGAPSKAYKLPPGFRIE